MKNKLKKIIAGAAAVAALGSANSAQADGSIELMAGNSGSSLDLKASTGLAPDLNLFTRHIVSADYENAVNYFGLADISFNIVDGLDAVAEVQALSGVGLTPRAGFQYFKGVDDWTFYLLTTIGIQENPVREMVLNVGYTPKLTDKVGLVINLEDVTDLGSQGHIFSTQKLRAGVSYDKFAAGAATDLTEAPGMLGYNIGGFAKVNF